MKPATPSGGKHYHACGDSFTAGSYVTDIDKATGEPLTANFLAAKYNNMKFTKDAIGGSYMTNVADASKPFSVDRYLNIPEDTDYLNLGGDPQVSLNIGGRRNGPGITFGETAKSLRSNQFQISITRTQPETVGATPPCRNSSADSNQRLEGITSQTRTPHAISH